MLRAYVTAFIVSCYISEVFSQDIAALILARGGSRGIPLKNLKEVGGISLLGRSILTAQKANLEVYVSTDHFLIALEGLRLLIQATSPFLTPRSIKDAIDSLNKYPEKDCVFSVVRSFHLRWETVEGLLVPKNFDPKLRPRRQDFKGELVEAGAFYIARRHLVEAGLLQNDK